MSRMEQMVMLAVRTLFVDSDYDCSHQHDFSYVSMSFLTPRKTFQRGDTLWVFRRGTYAAATWGGNFKPCSWRGGCIGGPLATLISRLSGCPLVILARLGMLRTRFRILLPACVSTKVMIQEVECAPHCSPTAVERWDGRPQTLAGCQNW
jgi:hypothetical protein